MKAFLITVLILGVTASSCARKIEPPIPVEDLPKAVSPKRAPAVKDKTTFERSESLRRCQDNPAECDGEALDMDIKKSVEKEIDPQSQLSTEFCIGGCTKKSIVNWSLEWK